MNNQPSHLGEITKSTNHVWQSFIGPVSREVQIWQTCLKSWGANEEKRGKAKIYRIDENLFIHGQNLRVELDGLLDAGLQLLEHGHAGEALRVGVEPNHA